MDIGKRIKAKRLEHAYTLEDLAKKVGTSKQTIQRYECGIISNIPSDKIEALAKALKTSPAYLMGWDIPQNAISEQQDMDIRRIERARQKMPEREKKKMMKILEASFEEYFKNSYVDDDIDE